MVPDADLWDAREDARKCREKADKLREALLKLAGLVIADHEALEKRYLKYAGEFEDVIKSRANVARRELATLNLEPPRSPYAVREPPGAAGPYEVVKVINGTWNVRDTSTGNWVPEGIWLSKPDATALAARLSGASRENQEGS